jgi:hypothetical protein
MQRTKEQNQLIPAPLVTPPTGGGSRLVSGDQMCKTALTETTENNRWYACFLKAVKEGYHKSAWHNIITDCNSDIVLFGYKYAKRRWSKFMSFHYPNQQAKETEMSTEAKAQALTEVSTDKKAQALTETQAHMQYKLREVENEDRQLPLL